MILLLGCVAGGAEPAVLPPAVTLPYRVAGTGGAEATVQVTAGDHALTGPHGRAIEWTVDGPFRLVDAPGRVGPGKSGDVVVAWDGAAIETIDRGTLRAETVDGAITTHVYAVAGDPAIPPATRAEVRGPAGDLRGTAFTVSLPTAPFPCEGFPWTDSTVRIFVPEHHRDRGAQDLVVHIHGWNQDIAQTLALHRYEDQLWASGANAVLVVPQGPWHARTGKFGKLLRPEGMTALVREVRVVLYRELGLTPELGDLALTAHSGGYQAVGAALDPGGPPVWMVGLFDALYGRSDAFEPFVRAGGRLRSMFTADGGTAVENTNLAKVLGDVGVKREPLPVALRDAGAVIWKSEADHDGTTRDEQAYAEVLRWGMRHSRRGPRVELRGVVGDREGASVRWVSPRDEDLTGFEVQRLEAGEWRVDQTVPPDAEVAHIVAPAWVRVVPMMRGIPSGEVLGSDVYRVAPGADVLVVDGIDRVVDGASPLLAHDRAAHAAEAFAVDTVSARYLGGIAEKTRYRAVLWLEGEDRASEGLFSASMRERVDLLVQGGNRIIVSAGALGTLDEGRRAWVAATFGATPTLPGGRSLGLPEGGARPPGAPPPARGKVVWGETTGLSAGPDAEVLARYTDGTPAVVRRGRATLVGFPLEALEPPEARAALLKLLGL